MTEVVKGQANNEGHFKGSLLLHWKPTQVTRQPDHVTLRVRNCVLRRKIGEWRNGKVCSVEADSIFPVTSTKLRFNEAAA